jgi:hypothetical protein
LTHTAPDARQLHVPLAHRPKQQPAPHDDPRPAQPNGRHVPLSQFPLQHSLSLAQKALSVRHVHAPLVQLLLQQSLERLHAEPSERHPVHRPAALQVWPNMQVPQSSIVPQPSLTRPHSRSWAAQS